MGKTITVSAIKADIGAIAGHGEPSPEVFEAVSSYVRKNGLESGLIIDLYTGYCGDDIHLVMAHEGGANKPEVHQLAYRAFMAGTDVARKQGLYAAGQDLLVDAPSGNIRGTGPGVAELEFEERPTKDGSIKANESFVVLAADKTEPGAFNDALYSVFCDPRRNSGLVLSPEMDKGFTLTIMDVRDDKGRTIDLNFPEDLIEIYALLMDTNSYAIAYVRSRNYPEHPVAAVSTDRLRNIAGKYVGKDDPIAIVRTQKPFPATEELGYQFTSIPYVDGDCRGSHRAALMPVKINTPSTTAMCNPHVSFLGFSMRDGKLTGPSDGFDHPFFDAVRQKAAEKSLELWSQPFGAKFVGKSELEYGGIRKKLEELSKRFKEPEKK